jgi:hypothetical protein
MKLDALDRLRPKEPKATRSTPGARQELQPLVITNGIDADTGASCDFTYAKLCQVHNTLPQEDKYRLLS